MKVGLITFHNALNYGAALQVYASQQALKQIGVDCEIINYVNEFRKNAYSMSYFIKEGVKKGNLKSVLKYSVGSPFMAQRRAKFQSFYKENLSCTQRLYKSSSEAEDLNTEYDKFIVGSDQVWNYKNNGNDFAYFLNFVKDNNKKIAYSSSFGLAEIPENLIGDYKKNLKCIKYLSTRESYGVKLIKEITGKSAELVLDPVFLLDKYQWKSLCKKQKGDKKYLFCYTNKMSQFDDFISQTGYPLDGVELHKLTQHLKVSDFLDPKVKVAYTISPVEFIETISNAELVVTASFHCIAISIILNKPFIAILTGDQGKDERVLNILRITGLESRILSEGMTIDEINKPIDFKEVDSKLEEYRNKSLNFLRNAIWG
ncbi:polysaccharide pyruvyl transferase family protein [Bacillus sp. T3]|uniref:polysaccharide pyruvyl transferase family protein n=1 Tax=Bacillus sp. T3 TaxID=467262 RepID=UPI002982789D|nr:polysaccharide pyruvyl transferase family protein [Bacillus sp. T3]